MFGHYHILRFIFYPIIGSALGSLTNYIAIKLLFRPRKKFLGIQGLFSKRKPEIAVRAGEIVNGYLVNSEEIRKQINGQRLHQAIERFLHRMSEKNGIVFFHLPIVRNVVNKFICSFLLDRDGFFSRHIIESVIDRDMVSGIVRQKINEFDVASIESLFKRASGPEINFIILSGAILGFIIGLVEAFIGL